MHLDIWFHVDVDVGGIVDDVARGRVGVCLGDRVGVDACVAVNLDGDVVVCVRVCVGIVVDGEF